MKDQSEHLKVIHNMPRFVKQKIEEAKKAMEAIFKIYDSLSKRNGKLNELVEIENKFHDSYIGFNSCLDDINCHLEDLPADDFKREQDLKDQIYISIYDDSLSGRG